MVMDIPLATPGSINPGKQDLIDVVAINKEPFMHVIGIIFTQDLPVVVIIVPPCIA